MGLYLVGWFDKPKWDDTDHRKAKSPDDIREVQRRLSDQASAVPGGYLVDAVVIDCHAP